MPSEPSDVPILDCRGLSKWYSGMQALKDVDFTAGRGEVVGLCGDNGAGKSTLIKILSGAQRPDKGTIFFDGARTVFRSPKDAMQRGIETIYQYTALVPQMSVARNMFIGREKTFGTLFGLGILNSAAMRRDAIAAIADVGLHIESADRAAADLSGGQRQGVVIARAMYFKSRVIILDEPTNHLSIKETNKVIDFVGELRDNGITSIFITHNLHHVFPLADRVVVMARGQKVADLKRAETSIKELTELII